MNPKLIAMKNFPLSAQFDPDLIYHDPDSWSEQEYREAKSEHIGKLTNAIANERASLRNVYTLHYCTQVRTVYYYPCAIIVADHLQAAQNFVSSLSFIKPKDCNTLALRLYDNHTASEVATELFLFLEKILHNASCALVPREDAIALIELSDRYIYTLD